MHVDNLTPFCPHVITQEARRKIDQVDYLVGLGIRITEADVRRAVAQQPQGPVRRLSPVEKVQETLLLEGCASDGLRIRGWCWRSFSDVAAALVFFAGRW